MDTPLQTSPDPKAFLQAVHAYYAELLHFHQRQAELVEKIVEKGFEGIEAAALYKEAQEGLREEHVSTNGAADGHVAPLPGQTQSMAEVAQGPPVVSKGTASRSTKKASAKKSTGSREPSSEVLPVKGDLGKSILKIMRESPETPATASSIAAALNPSGIPQKERAKATSRYADRLGTLVKRNNLIRIANGIFMLADAPPDAVARARDEFSTDEKGSSQPAA